MFAVLVYACFVHACTVPYTRKHLGSMNAKNKDHRIYSVGFILLLMCIYVCVHIAGLLCTCLGVCVMKECTLYVCTYACMYVCVYVSVLKVHIVDLVMHA